VSAPPPAPPRPWLLLLLGAVVFAVYLKGLTEWTFVGDDAYISFRYALQLVRGNGLVWNPGEYVEGYTNFLWVLLVAAGLAVGVAPTTSSVAAGVASGVLVLWMATRRAAAEWGGAHPALWSVALIAAATRSFCAWSTSGLETMGFTALVLAGLLAAEREHLAPERAPWRSSTCLALAVWMRPDGVLFVAVVGLLHALDALRGRRAWGSAGAWLAPLIALVGGHELFRWFTYGDLVPNTFHAKVNGAWLDQGLTYLALAHEDYGVGWVAWLGLIPLLTLRRRIDLLFASAVAAQLAFILYVGGDRFEFRFLVPILLPALWLMVEGLTWCVGRTTRGGWIVLLAAALAATSVHLQGLERRGQIRDEVEQIPFIRTFAARRAEQGQQLRRLVDRGLLPADLRIAVGAAGALPYYADLHTTDVFGLNDREIATREVERTDRSVPAHEKHATAADLVKRRVELYDATGWLFTDRLSLAQRAWEKQARKVRKLRGGDVLFPVCFRQGGQWMVFLTTLDNAGRNERFGQLEPCEAGALEAAR
jgi:arabinofuranosyltransferase